MKLTIGMMLKITQSTTDRFSRDATNPLPMANGIPMTRNHKKNNGKIAPIPPKPPAPMPGCGQAVNPNKSATNRVALPVTTTFRDIVISLSMLR